MLQFEQWNNTYKFKKAIILLFDYLYAAQVYCSYDLSVTLKIQQSAVTCSFSKSDRSRCFISGTNAVSSFQVRFVWFTVKLQIFQFLIIIYWQQPWSESTLRYQQLHLYFIHNSYSSKNASCERHENMKFNIRSFWRRISVTSSAVAEIFLFIFIAVCPLSRSFCTVERIRVFSNRRSTESCFKDDVVSGQSKSSHQNQRVTHLQHNEVHGTRMNSL